MNTKQLVQQWFDLWITGDYPNLPLSDNFTHTSPFGTIHGKTAYIDIIKENEEKFLGYTFELHDGIYQDQKACVQYTAKQGDDFRLNISEWYYIEKGLIDKIVSYYHIGEIRQDRKIEEYTR